MRIAADLIQSERARIRWARTGLEAEDAKPAPDQTKRRVFLDAMNWHERTISSIEMIFPELKGPH